MFNIYNDNDLHRLISHAPGGGIGTNELKNQTDVPEELVVDPKYSGDIE